MAIPYAYITKEKNYSLGETMTLKEALDLWWNSIRIDDEGFFKDCDGEYNDFEGNIYDENDEKLNKRITLSKYYDEDEDGYPIVYANWEEDYE